MSPMTNAMNISAPRDTHGTSAWHCPVAGAVLLGSETLVRSLPG